MCVCEVWVCVMLIVSFTEFRQRERVRERRGGGERETDETDERPIQRPTGRQRGRQRDRQRETEDEEHSQKLQSEQNRTEHDMEERGIELIDSRQTAKEGDK